MSKHHIVAGDGRVGHLHNATVDAAPRTAGAIARDGRFIDGHGRILAVNAGAPAVVIGDGSWVGGLVPRDGRIADGHATVNADVAAYVDAAAAPGRVAGDDA